MDPHGTTAGASSCLPEKEHPPMYAPAIGDLVVIEEVEPTHFVVSTPFSATTTVTVLATKVRPA